MDSVAYFSSSIKTSQAITYPRVFFSHSFLLLRTKSPLLLYIPRTGRRKKNIPSLTMDSATNLFPLLAFLLLTFLFSSSQAQQSNVTRTYTFVIKAVNRTRLCSTKSILTVNGMFPGPTLYAHKGETFIVNVINNASANITIHWHGVKQPKYPWSDGPEYITQCPIQPGGNFSQKVILSSEEGTLWWHAHSAWYRATIHGAIVLRPSNGTHFPFPKPYADIPIILGEWWKSDVNAVLQEMKLTGNAPNLSDAYTINGKPGDLYPCSKNGTYKIRVKQGNTYLLRLISSVMQEISFLAVAGHNLTVIGSDGSYTKPYVASYIAISPGETIDVLLHANQTPQNYYMAFKAYSSTLNLTFDNTTATAIISYYGGNTSAPMQLPSLPASNDTVSSLNFTKRLRSLASKEHPMYVPLNITTKLMLIISINTFPCAEDPCNGSTNGTRLAASINNVSFTTPTTSILEAYYYNISGVYEDDFPHQPPLVYNYSSDYLPVYLQDTMRGTKVVTLEYNATVEIVFQSTGLLGGADHPMHMHGHSFLVVGMGLGNFNESVDPQNYNLLDPPLLNTIAVPRNGWVAIRYQTRNPGVWFLHCHLERHLSWGMEMAFITKNGNGTDQQLLPPPDDIPPC